MPLSDDEREHLKTRNAIAELKACVRRYPADCTPAKLATTLATRERRDAQMLWRWRDLTDEPIHARQYEPGDTFALFAIQLAPPLHILIDSNGADNPND